jgi:hypothetical protein
LIDRLVKRGKGVTLWNLKDIQPKLTTYIIPHN